MRIHVHHTYVDANDDHLTNDHDPVLMNDLAYRHFYHFITSKNVHLSTITYDFYFKWFLISVYSVFKLHIASIL